MELQIDMKVQKSASFEANKEVLERDYRSLELVYTGVLSKRAGNYIVESEIGPGFQGDEGSKYLIDHGELTSYACFLVGAFGRGKLLRSVCERYRARYVRRMTDVLDVVKNWNFEADKEEGDEEYDQLRLCIKGIEAMAHKFSVPFLTDGSPLGPDVFEYTKDMGRFNAMLLGFAVRQTVDVPDSIMEFAIEASKPVKDFKVGDTVTNGGVEYKIVGAMLGDDFARFACSNDKGPELWFELEELEAVEPKVSE